MLFHHTTDIRLALLVAVWEAEGEVSDISVLQKGVCPGDLEGPILITEAEAARDVLPCGGGGHAPCHWTVSELVQRRLRLRVRL